MSMPVEKEQAIKTKCIALGSTLPPGSSHSADEHACNVAGVKGWPLVGALNKIAGNAPAHYRDAEGVLNQLAGTTGWGENGAASRWAGLI